MREIWDTLPGAVMAGLGAMLCSLGYRLVRFHALKVGVWAFAALGCGAGALAGWPALAAFLCVAGAVLGYALGPVLFHVYVGAAAALGGAAVGLLLAGLTHYSNPVLLCGATALGCTIIALLDSRVITIVWTSTVGAALVALGILLALPGPNPASLKWTLVTVGAALLSIGVYFQLRTGDAEPAGAAKPEPTPSA